MKPNNLAGWCWAAFAVLVILALICNRGGGVRRGYFGVGVFQPKTLVNIGTLWRSASIMGADFIFTIGKRYKSQSSDTTKTPKHIPLFHYSDADDFWKNGIPNSCPVIGVELHESAQMLEKFHHPTRAIYMLGAEDNGIPPIVLDRCHHIIKLRGEYSMNVAVAGSIVMYHRITQVDL